MIILLLSVLGLLLVLSFRQWVIANPECWLMDYIQCRPVKPDRFGIDCRFNYYSVKEYWVLETVFGKFIHRRDGPAVIYRDGTYAWFWMDTEVSLEEYVRKNNRLNSPGEKMYFYMHWAGDFKGKTVD